MIRPNVKHVNVAELILEKQKQADRLAKARLDRASDLLAWVITFCVSITMVLVLVSLQEGWW
jgi:hypothetical protein